jgi:prolyl oligopeptidase
MRVRSLFTISVFLAVVVSVGRVNSADQSAPPIAPVKPVQDSYSGTTISDPYRYMENLKDPAVQNWIKGQDDYTRSVLATIPGRQQLLARLKELDQTVPRVSARKLPGDVYLISKRLPTEDVDKLYIRHGLAGEDKLLVDPEKVALAPALKGKGKNAIQYFEPSRNGNLVAVGIAPGGSERDTEIHFFETGSGRQLGDVIARAWGGGTSWLADNHSLAYIKLRKLPPSAPVTETEQKVRTYLHVLGQDAEKDPAVFGWNVLPSITVDLTLPACQYPQIRTMRSDRSTAARRPTANSIWSPRRIWANPIRHGANWRISPMMCRIPSYTARTSIF